MTTRLEKIHDFGIFAIVAIFFVLPILGVLVWATLLWLGIIVSGGGACPPRASC
jgi:hypothetical protein